MADTLNNTIAATTIDATGEKAGPALCAVIFDLDGVLIHSAPCHRDAFIEVFRPLGIENFDYSRFAGWRTREVVDLITAEAGLNLPEAELAGIAAHKSELARQMMANSHPIAPGCVEMLQRLTAEGFALALASSGSRESVGMFLDTTGTRPLFRSVLTGGDVKHAKPDPEIYTRTFQRIGLDPAEGIIVEDAVAGVLAARAAGSQAVGIAGTCQPEDLKAAGALDVLNAVATLPSWLAGHCKELRRREESR